MLGYAIGGKKRCLIGERIINLGGIAGNKKPARWRALRGN